MNPISTADMEAIVQFAFGRERQLLSSIPLSGGLINATQMLVLDGDERLVLRVAPDSATAEAGPSWLTPYGLRREAAALALLDDLGDLRPATVASDFEQAVLDRDWVLQRVMPGVPLETVDEMLPDDVRETIWREVGAATSTMHRQRAAFFGAAAWGPEHESWSGLVRRDVAGCLDDADRYGLDAEPFRTLLELIGSFAPVLDAVRTPSLIHSDLFPPHLFVADDDEDGSLHLAGIIDFEFARFADPLSEHLLAQAVVADADDVALVAFREGYGALPEIVGAEVRQAIHGALDHAWNITLAAFQQRETAALMAELATAVAVLEQLA